MIYCKRLSNIFLQNSGLQAISIHCSFDCDKTQIDHLMHVDKKSNASGGEKMIRMIQNENDWDEHSTRVWDVY